MGKNGVLSRLQFIDDEVATVVESIRNPTVRRVAVAHGHEASKKCRGTQTQTTSRTRFWVAGGRRCDAGESSSAALNRPTPSSRCRRAKVGRDPGRRATVVTATNRACVTTPGQTPRVVHRAVTAFRLTCRMSGARADLPRFGAPDLRPLNIAITCRPSSYPHIPGIMPPALATLSPYSRG
jgi:hypothetical protein